VTDPGIPPPAHGGISLWPHADGERRLFLGGEDVATILVASTPRRGPGQYRRLHRLAWLARHVRHGGDESEEIAAWLRENGVQPTAIGDECHACQRNMSVESES
jgi:hypothetical protein